MFEYWPQLLFLYLRHSIHPQWSGFGILRHPGETTRVQIHGYQDCQMQLRKCSTWWHNVTKELQTHQLIHKTAFSTRAALSDRESQRALTLTTLSKLVLGHNTKSPYINRKSISSGQYRIQGNSRKQENPYRITHMHWELFVNIFHEIHPRIILGQFLLNPQTVLYWNHPLFPQCGMVHLNHTPNLFAC